MRTLPDHHLRIHGVGTGLRGVGGDRMHVHLRWRVTVTFSDGSKTQQTITCHWQDAAERYLKWTCGRADVVSVESEAV